MKGYTAFVRKEFLEQRRTYKLLIMLAVFTIFGTMSPLLAKLMPEIFKSMAIEGMTITIPEPTFMDAYAQFFKNVTQMGVVVLLLVFSGSMSHDLSKGTLTNVLAKGLKRASVVLAKYTACLTLWTVSLALSAAVNYGYTMYLFGSHTAANLFLSLLCLWLFGAFLLAAGMFTGTLFKGGYSGLLATASVLGILMLLSILPGSRGWNPVTMAAVNMGLIDGSIAAAGIMSAFWLTLGASALFIAGAILVFRKKQL
jgi:ABC-2 type transport system permease protein